MSHATLRVTVVPPFGYFLPTCRWIFFSVVCEGLTWNLYINLCHFRLKFKFQTWPSAFYSESYQSLSKSPGPQRHHDGDPFQPVTRAVIHQGRLPRCDLELETFFLEASESQVLGGAAIWVPKLQHGTWMAPFLSFCLCECVYLNELQKNSFKTEFFRWLNPVRGYFCPSFLRGKVCLFLCLFDCDTATPLTLPRSWEHIRVVRNSKVAVKFLARIERLLQLKHGTDHVRRYHDMDV